MWTRWKRERQPKIPLFDSTRSNAHYLYRKVSKNNGIKRRRFGEPQEREKRGEGRGEERAASACFCARLSIEWVAWMEGWRGEDEKTTSVINLFEISYACVCVCVCARSASLFAEVLFALIVMMPHTHRSFAELISVWCHIRAREIYLLPSSFLFPFSLSLSFARAAAVSSASNGRGLKIHETS